MRFLFLVLIFPLLSVKAQTPDLRAKIDSTFAEWNTPSVPGVAIGVVRDGNSIYQKGFGMSNLKNNDLIDSTTEFWIASVTKQFTAFGIYFLEASGKLNLNNSIRRYIPGLPELFEPITIEQLLHHTSGVRDGFVLTALSKKTEEEFTNENVLKYLKLQRELNFKPGSTHEYNNSGYVLLAQVIEQVAKTTYPEFMKTKVFTPLAMTHTYVSGKYPSNSKMSEGYRSKDYSNSAGSFQEGHFMGNTYGSTGIITTISDIEKWAKFFQSAGGNPSYAKAKARLLETGTLNSGETIGYAGGLERLQHNGAYVYEHFGADEGFKANILFLPSQNLSVFGLTNNATNFGLSDKLYAIADIVLGQGFEAPSLPASDQNSIWEQSYFSPDPFPAYRHVTYYLGFAKVSEIPRGPEIDYYNKKDIFQTNEAISRSFLQISKEKVYIHDPYNHQNKTLPAIQLSDRSADFQTFAGKYYSDELETDYEIILDKGQLFFEFVPGVRLKLKRLNNSYFLFDYYGANYVEFLPNGFSLSREGIQKLRLRKLQLN